MIKNGKEVNKEMVNGYRKKVNGILYICMEERNENN